MASTNKVWRKLPGVEGIVVAGWEFDEALVVAVRTMKRGRRRCPYCRVRCGRYGPGSGRRRWRGLDLGTTRLYLEAEAVRVRCPTYGVVVAEVTWARPGSGFTRAFEEHCAWLTVQASRTAVAHLMRVAWRSVGRMLRRVADERSAGRDLLDRLERIGIDELSYRKGHKHVTVVIDHDSGRLV